MLIKEDNSKKTSDKINLLGTSFLKFSEIQEEIPGNVKDDGYYSNQNYDSETKRKLQAINLKGKKQVINFNSRSNFNDFNEIIVDLDFLKMNSIY